MSFSKYRGGGSSEIEGISDDDLIPFLFDWILEYTTWDPEAKATDLSALSEAERAIYHAWIVDCEVKNGGFNQYFFNTRGRHLESVLQAYELIGASAHLELFHEAIAKACLVADAHLHAAQQRPVEAMLAAFSRTYEDNPLNALDDKYYDLSPTIEANLIRFIRANAGVFVETD